MFFTIAQTRYLLNASDVDGSGYLNMQLTEDEWNQMMRQDGRSCTFGLPSCLPEKGTTNPRPGWNEEDIFRPALDPKSKLWARIRDGLKLFGIRESEVDNIVRIPINVQGIENPVSEALRPDHLQIQRPRAIVAVAGDSAMPSRR